MDLISQINETIEHIKNNNQDDRYSNEQDSKIIEFFNNNMIYLKFRNDEKVYKMLQNKYFFKNTTTSLKNRFNNTILPNLYKYPILSYSRMILFYDKAGLEMPEELQRLLCEKIENQEASSPKSSVEYTDFDCTSIANEICVCVNNVKHIFLLKNAPNIKNTKRCLIQEHGILRSNIHLLQQQAYQFINEYKKHKNIFRYEIMTIIKPFLQISESIDIDTDSFCENERISNKIIDLDKTKTCENGKIENLELSKIFCISLKPQLEKEKLSSIPNNVNNFIVKHVSTSKLVDHNIQERLKQINIESEEQEQLVNSVRKPIKPFLIDVNEKQVQKPIISVNSKSKNVDNLSVKPSYNANGEKEEETIQNIAKLLLSFKNSASVNKDNPPTEMSHLDDNKKQDTLKRPIKSQLRWLENSRKRQNNRQSTTKKMVNNTETDEKSLSSNVTIEHNKKFNLNSSSLNTNCDLEDKPLSKFNHVLSSKVKSTNKNVCSDPEDVSLNIRKIKQRRKRISINSIDDSDVSVNNRKIQQRSNRIRNSTSDCTKKMENSTEVNKNPLSNNVSFQPNTQSDLDSLSLNTNCDLEDIPLSKLKNMLASKAKVKSTNKNVYSYLKDVPLNIRKIKISSSTNYDSDLEYVPFKKRKYKQHPKKVPSSTNYYSNLEDIPVNERKHKQSSKKLSSCTDLEDVPTKECNIKRCFINEIISNIYIEHCYGKIEEENNITNQKVITDSDEEFASLEKADVNSTAESTIISDFSQNCSSRSIEPIENALKPALEEENEMGSNMPIENTHAISSTTNQIRAESETEIVSFPDDILTSQQSSSESSNFLSLYGPSELEMLEINISTAWMCKIYQFSKRLTQKIISHSLNIDHCKIRFADPVKIKTEL